MIRRLAVATLSLTIAAGCAAFQPAFAQGADKEPGGRLVKAFEKLDANKDGAVDREELEQQRARAFQRFDTNKDGAIDRAEVDALVKKREARGGRGSDRVAKQFQAADKDRDGRVTKAEFLDKMPPWFARADANRDGKVTRQELDAFIADRKAKRAKREDAGKGAGGKDGGKDM